MSSTEIRKAMEETGDLVRAIAWGLDYGSEVPCEPEGIECDVPATWLWHHCCQSATYCDTHHAHMLKFAERYHPANVRHQCSYCFTDPMPRPTWRPI